mmetsp:Transcript_22005/g.53875  ORF Transcript_22005/g.53875 Transcript_22005/m.53875 type:complete len:176 (-) Transcript_22005:619-1146(-)|eukprot:CAMPEP_0114518104 /NCGR_PEP_ID=MMETSP0109-20121206/18261_1 /TAXON_ID=29199 /ORGANISM="Chlorarachnion reptans, Strain CCCM449" /LENGTH=175 /DNA_ID=CAMNT_0001698693 /DNA_START=140 /DNA_END=667 /DNA_ORIENTATION=-
MRVKNGGIKTRVERKSMAWNLRKAKRSRVQGRISTLRIQRTVGRRLSAPSPLLSTRISNLTISTSQEAQESIRIKAPPLDLDSLESSSDSEDEYEFPEDEVSTPVKFKGVPGPACLKPKPFRPLSKRQTNSTSLKIPSLPNLPQVSYGENVTEKTVTRDCITPKFTKFEKSDQLV